MNRILAPLLLLILFLSFGCTIQKRQFRSGWHFSSKQSYSANQEKEKSNKKIRSSKEVSQLDIITLKQHNQCTAQRNTEQIKPKKKPLRHNKLSATSNNYELSKEFSVQPIDQNKINRTSQNKPLRSHDIKRVWEDPEPENDDSDGHWFPRFAGVFFGVLLGLIAFVPLFYVVCFFFLVDGKVSDLTFEKKDTDTSFIRSFKRAYHAVFRVGLLLMIIFLIFGAAMLIIIIAYIVLNIIGLILGSLIALLILFLFIRSWRNLLDALMFDE